MRLILQELGDAEDEIGVGGKIEAENEGVGQG